MSTFLDHLVIAPILVPLLASALMVLLKEQLYWLKRTISLATTFILLIISLLLLQAVESDTNHTLTYLLGNWPAPFSIVLVADRLSAIMLALSSILGVVCLVYSFAKWDRAGPRFHALFVLLLMGVNGAFLTGDLFNLFVFFEVMLAASYGLALHGSGVARIKASLHYIAINIATSLLFLIGVALIYAMVGTLNMADVAVRMSGLSEADAPIFRSGHIILCLAFLVKAGMWPLGFWLTTTYTVAAPPVAAFFAIMSKVGIYAIMRINSLTINQHEHISSGFTREWLTIGGIATIIFGTISILAANRLGRIAGSYIMISSGTLLVAIGVGNEGILSAAIFYLISSTLAIAAFYLLIEPIERTADVSSADGGRIQQGAVFEDEDPPLLAEEDEEDEVGIVIPATIAILGSGFAFCALILAGMPPLSGFVAKFGMIRGLLGYQTVISPSTWATIGVIMFSGLAALIATTRAGITLLWAPAERQDVKLKLTELVPVGALLIVCLWLVISAGSIMQLTRDTARSLANPTEYITTVLSLAPSGDAQ